MKLLIMQFSPPQFYCYCFCLASSSSRVLRRCMQLGISGRHIVTCVCVMMQVRILLSLTLSLCLQECWGRGVLLLRVCIDQCVLYKSS